MPILQSRDVNLSVIGSDQTILRRDRQTTDIITMIVAVHKYGL